MQILIDRDGNIYAVNIVIPPWFKPIGNVTGFLSSTAHIKVEMVGDLDMLSNLIEQQGE